MLFGFLGAGQKRDGVADQCFRKKPALVEEGAAAAESLHGQALRLGEALAVYRADAEQAPSARAAQPQRTQSTAKAPLRLAAKAP